VECPFSFDVRATVGIDSPDEVLSRGLVGSDSVDVGEVVTLLFDPKGFVKMEATLPDTGGEGRGFLDVEVVGDKSARETSGRAKGCMGAEGPEGAMALSWEMKSQTAVAFGLSVEF
jgi:hypothetical protein